MGTSGGQILEFALPGSLPGVKATPSKRKRPAPEEVAADKGTVFASTGGASAVDCLRAAPGGRVAAKTADGRVSVWGPGGAQVSAWKARR